MSFTNQTKMSKSPFQNINAVSTLKEISDDTAASCNGGLEAVTLYAYNFQDPNFDPNAALAVDGNISNLTSKNFNDVTSSVIVREGKWELAPEAGYKDTIKDGSGIIELTPGSYNDADLQAKGLKNDTLSSIRRVG
jgi:Beta/Gamma crystallin